MTTRLAYRYAFQLPYEIVSYFVIKKHPEAFSNWDLVYKSIPTSVKISVIKAETLQRTPANLLSAQQKSNLHCLDKEEWW